MRNDWTEVRLKSSFPTSSGDPFNAFDIEVVAPTLLEASLFQSGLRGQHDHLVTVDLGVCVLFTPRGKEDLETELVADCRRRVETLQVCETGMLSRTDGVYTVLPTSLNQLGLGGAPREFVVAIHTTKPVVVQPRKVGAHIVGNALCLQAQKHGERREPFPGMLLYQYQSMFVAVNRGRQHFQVEINVDEVLNFVSSRGLMGVQSSVRPGYRQLIVAYTEAFDQMESKIRYK